MFLGPAERKNITNLFCFERAHFKVFVYIFFHGTCKPFNEPKTSRDWTHKYHKMAPLIITHSLYWTFFYLLYLLSLIGIFFRYLFVLTYVDSSWRHTHATTHPTGMQMFHAKMMSLDAIFCKGNKSSSSSLAHFCLRKHKKSTAQASHSWKNLS